MLQTSNVDLTADERVRYGRQMLLPEIGAAGQARLKRASVLIVGLGGLGCPASIYLAAAGVGRLGLVDFDRVDTSNLHRQVLYGAEDVGRLKVEVAECRLRAIHPNLRIGAHAMRLNGANALELISQYDVILDGADNFPTRYLVNDACVLAGKPNVHGSVFRFEGTVAVFHHNGGPCQRCLYPQPPPEGTVPDCASGGVLGVLPGLIGLLQATEAIKLIAGIGRPLSGRLLLYDALTLTFRELTVARDPACPICGERPTIASLREEGGCLGAEACVEATDTITPAGLEQRLQAADAPALLDVRQPHEFAAGHLPGARLIPLGDLERRLGELDPTAEWVVYCHVGARSRRAVDLLRGRGFDRALNLVGGIAQWNGPRETA